MTEPQEVDPDDPRLADYRHLTDAAARRAIEGPDGAGIFIAEGVLALRQLLRSSYRVRSILSTPTRADAVRAELRAAVNDGCTAADAPHLVAPRALLESITGYDVHRGTTAGFTPSPANLVGSTTPTDFVHAPAPPGPTTATS